MLWQIALALGEEREFIRRLRFFFKFYSGCTKFEDRAPHSYGWAVCIILSLGEVEIGPGIHMYDFDFAPRWNQNVCSSWNLLKIWVKVFLSTGYSGIYTHFLTWYIRGWLLRGGEMENILLFTSTEFGWDGIYQLILILILINIYWCHFYKKIIIISDIILSIFISLLSVMEKD